LTEDTPFALAFGSKGRIPASRSGALDSYRVDHFNSKHNTEGLKLNLDLLKESREQAGLRAATYQRKEAQYFKSKVKTRKFSIWDLVLREVTIGNTKYC